MIKNIVRNYFRRKGISRGASSSGSSANRDQCLWVFTIILSFNPKSFLKRSTGKLAMVKFKW